MGDDGAQESDACPHFLSSTSDDVRAKHHPLTIQANFQSRPHQSRIRKKAAKRRSSSRKALGEPSDLALYDGIRYIGRIVGRKADGFAARTPGGKCLGSFASIREAAAGLSAYAAVGGR